MVDAENFGVEKVSILAGVWLAGSATNCRCSRGRDAAGGDFDATFDANVVKRLTDVLVVSHENTAQIVDARPAARFNAEADEPRPA